MTLDRDKGGSANRKGNGPALMRSGLSNLSLPICSCRRRLISVDQTSPSPGSCRLPRIENPLFQMEKGPPDSHSRRLWVEAPHLLPFRRGFSGTRPRRWSGRGLPHRNRQRLSRWRLPPPNSRSIALSKKPYSHVRFTVPERLNFAFAAVPRSTNSLKDTGSHANWSLCS
jgi:hypothetical protein